MITFYNCDGKPTIYTDDLTHLYSFSGDPVGYIYLNCIYTFSGKNIGFLIDGWIRDLNGYCVFFSDNAIGGMVKPAKIVLPTTNAKRTLPLKRIREIPHLLPVKRLAWSRYSNVDFFK